MATRDPESEEELSEEEALIEAIKKGNLDQVEEMLKQWQKTQRSTPPTPEDLGPFLVKAVGRGSIPIVDFLLGRGATVSASEISVAYGPLKSPDDSLALFQTFHKHGWDVNSKNVLRKPALWHFVNNEPLMRWFLENGADASFGEFGHVLLQRIAACSTPRMFDLLVAYGARTEDSEALHAAAGQIHNYPGRLEMMQHLLNLGFDPNAMGWLDHHMPYGDIERGTPLHAAMTQRQNDRIDFLLRHGADPEMKNTLGQTPLEWAIASGRDSSASFLKNWQE